MKKPENTMDLEQRLLFLQQKCVSEHISLGEILKTLHGKGQPLILLLLSLLFCQPIQIPGLSIPFGLAISFIGLRIALGKHMSFPKQILEKTITSDHLKKIIDKTIWVVRKMKRWIHPRLTFLCLHPIIKIFHGCVIFFLGLLLALPLPIPLSNLTAAWSIFFIGLGMLEDDGVLILIGYLSTIMTVIFFLTIVLSIKSIF